jgi:hypothetical protein
VRRLEVRRQSSTKTTVDTGYAAGDEGFTNIRFRRAPATTGTAG